jgi:hypothetical protein
MSSFRRSSPFRFVLAASFTLFLVSGCSKDENKTTEPATSSADQLVAQANAKLGDVLYAQMNGAAPSRPSDIDLHEPYALYQQALTKEPTNASANFGVAVLGMLSLTYDTEVNAAFDEWKTYLQSRVPFQARAGRGRELGVPLTFVEGGDAMRLPFDLVPLSALAPVRGPLIATDPQIGRFQAILRDVALPKLTEAVTRLHTAASPSFRFWVTPKMQGDLGADSVEIDQTDLLALASACGLLASACHVAVAYEAGFAAYDSSSLYTALQPGSPWLALRSDGAAHMAAAGTAISGSIVDLDAAIVSLEGETDPQDNDVIRRGPSGLTIAQLDSIRTTLQHVTSSMTAGFTITDDWDNNPYTPKVPLTIRAGQLFQNPIANWKEKLPAYTASVEARPFAKQYDVQGGAYPALVNPPGAGYYSFYYFMNVDRFGTPYSYEFGDGLLASSVHHVLDSLYTYVAGVPAWGGDFYGSASVYLYAGAGGDQWVQISWSYTYSIATSRVYVPVIHWVAATAGDWTWPDPTFNGLLPGMSSSAEMLTTFGYDPSSWTRDVVLDWTGISGAPAGAARARSGVTRGIATDGTPARPLARTRSIR